MTSLVEVLTNEYQVNPKAAKKLVQGYEMQLNSNPELKKDFPLIRDHFEDLKQEDPVAAQAILISVIANGFMIVAGHDGEKLQSASRDAFSGDPDSLQRIPEFKLDPTWNRFQQLFGEKMSNQPVAREVFGKRKDLDPQLWQLSTYLTMLSYMSVAHLGIKK